MHDHPGFELCADGGLIACADDPACATTYYATEFSQAAAASMGGCETWAPVVMAAVVNQLSPPLADGQTLDALCPVSCQSSCVGGVPPPPPAGGGRSNGGANQCAGRSSGNYVDFNGIRYATLTDGISPYHTDPSGYLGDSTELPLPGLDWTIADYSTAVGDGIVAPYPWSTDCAIFSNSESYCELMPLCDFSPLTKSLADTAGNDNPGGSCGGDELRPNSDGINYGLRDGCCRRIIVQCVL